ncbi:phosphatidylinositol diacylglycerol-lyase [Vibrio navarrensis]|uniref:phosphatidylinositol-specific phospholipase C n=1 Tax=Vibrio navarrensis TaxID=29495 RepID=UPI00192F30BF|nr:phosphatidylinositol-specific phospholipase C [Vibrio navarrensis]MBE3668509.1 phosphatidylinositol diacylglycerol-lyase [Vibrio navarrensis]
MTYVETRNWMSALDHQLTLDQISLPGTHDSGTQKAPAGPARTQNFGIYTQLNNGIRFLDIRVKANDSKLDPLSIFHGIVNCDISFADVLDDCQQFLSENPTETIVMLMNAATGNGNDIQVKFDEYIAQKKYQHLFYLGSRMPTLTAVQSKIVLLRRFPGNIGIDLSKGWKKNKTFTLTTPENQVFAIEDQYQEHDTRKKMAAVQASIDSAIAAPDDGVMHLTYNSISFSLLGHTPYQYAWGGGIGKISPKMNPGLAEFLRGKKKGNRFGIVVLDFYNNELGHIDNSVTELVISTNPGVALNNNANERDPIVNHKDHSYI